MSYFRQKKQTLLLSARLNVTWPMLKVEKYIEKLLLTHDCVIIPGLGGFVAQYEPAYRVEQNGTFYPPYRTIGFNAQLKMNDGLLAQAYMQAYDTNFPEASRMVEREAERIKRNLHSDGHYRFEDLGNLELTSDGHLLFTPESEGGIVAPELYGLDAFMMAPYSAPVATGSATETTQTPQPAVVVPLETGPQETSDQKSGHYVIRLNRTLTNCVAAAVVAVIFYFALAIPVSDNEATPYRTADATNSVLYGFPVKKLTPNLNPQPAAVARPSSATTPEKAEPKAGNATTTAGNKRQPTSETPNALSQATADHDNTVHAVTETTTVPYYTIVLASAIKESNARIFIDQLKSEGFGEARFYKKKSMKRVIYSHFSSQEEAQRALHKLRDNEAFEQAWVLEIK